MTQKTEKVKKRSKYSTTKFIRTLKKCDHIEIECSTNHMKKKKKKSMTQKSWNLKSIKS